jgi:hypothetical protein
MFIRIYSYHVLQVNSPNISAPEAVQPCLTDNTNFSRRALGKKERGRGGRRSWGGRERAVVRRNRYGMGSGGRRTLSESHLGHADKETSQEHQSRQEQKQFSHKRLRIVAHIIKNPFFVMHSLIEALISHLVSF